MMRSLQCLIFSACFAAVCFVSLISSSQAATNFLDALNHELERDPDFLRHPVSRVYGGQPINEGTFPYARIRLTRRGNEHQCGGTIVAPDIILTAAHCLEWFDSVRIYLETSSGASHYITIPFTDIFIHPEYNSKTFESDIMAIKISRPLDMSHVIQINNGFYEPRKSQSLLVVGWGATAEGFPKTMHYAEVPYVPNGWCENTEVDGEQMYKGIIFPSMMCAGGYGRDACQGDSGSPLVKTTEARDILVGLVSWGRGCAVYPGVYTRISFFYNWVRENICWFSVEPPEYLECAEDERNPDAVESEIYPLLTSKPSASPVRNTNKSQQSPGTRAGDTSGTRAGDTSGSRTGDSGFTSSDGDRTQTKERDYKSWEVSKYNTSDAKSNNQMNGFFIPATVALVSYFLLRQ